MSRYQQYCETACPDGCGKGNPPSYGRHYTDIQKEEYFPCTALPLAAWAEELAGKLEQAQRIVNIVDDVLIVNWVGPRIDGDYKRALGDLVTSAISEHKYFHEHELQSLTAERDRLARELAAMTEARDGLMEAHANLGAEAARLESELAEAKRDGNGCAPPSKPRCPHPAKETAMPEETLVPLSTVMRVIQQPELPIPTDDLMWAWEKINDAVRVRCGQEIAALEAGLPSYRPGHVGRCHFPDA